ncbi:hypothetical protein [Pseudomonas syringae group genomosp. 3]|uniref:hypothetical protein n=1 Tax=Pseudomonas syringae group genomosp. 3 TaxID=251701 RepID=UPI000EFE6E16|nr:hypothetical protein [Pseudomonas syringae group genomosp. 3]
MRKVKPSESTIIRDFESNLLIKFKELEVYQKGLDAMPIIYNQQITELHQMHCRITKLSIVGVKVNSTQTTIAYEALTDQGPKWYEIGFKLIPMHTVH